MATQATADEEGRVGFFWGAAGRSSLRAEAPQGAGRADAGPRMRRKSDSVVEQPALRAATVRTEVISIAEERDKEWESQRTPGSTPGSTASCAQAESPKGHASSARDEAAGGCCSIQ